MQKLMPQGLLGLALATFAVIAAVAVVLVVVFIVKGDDDKSGVTTIKAGQNLVVNTTAIPTAAIPAGPFPTRAVDFDALCQKGTQKKWTEMPTEPFIDPELSYTAVIKTEKGDVTLRLLPDLAPWTVNNFVFLSCSGFYDNLTFHRVVLTPSPPSVPHPYVQAGDPSGYALADPNMGGPGYSIPTEISDRPFTKGTVAMSSRGLGSPVNGSQFFIMLEDSPELNGQFTIFAEVVSGFEVLTQLTPRNPQEHGPPGDRIIEITVQEGS